MSRLEKCKFYCLVKTTEQKSESAPEKIVPVPPVPETVQESHAIAPQPPVHVVALARVKVISLGAG